MENFYRRVRIVEAAGIILVEIIRVAIILRVQRKNVSQGKLPGIYIYIYFNNSCE